MTICKNCVMGNVPLGIVYYDEEEGYNTGGIGKPSHTETYICKCCNGNYQDCKNCKKDEEK